MEDALFQELLQSVKEAGEIRCGEREPSRSLRYKGKVLVEIKENGRWTWHIEEAARELAAQMEASGTLDVKAIRETLRQSQEGFAALLGISVGTLRGWEQGHREPQGPARVLLGVAARHPEVLLETVNALRAA